MRENIKQPLSNDYKKIEEQVRERRGAISNANLMRKLENIIPNLRFSKSRDTKYILNLYLYWHKKELIACHIDSMGENNN